MKQIVAHGLNKVYQLRVKEAKLTRRYEEKEYALVAGDLQLECVDASELYADVIAGKTISVVVYVDNDIRFRGTIAAEGAAYDPETEVYTFTAPHLSKQLFDAARNERVNKRDSVGNWIWPSHYVRSFDGMSVNQFGPAGMMGLCDVILNPLRFERRNSAGFTTAAWDRFTEQTNYSFREYWIDFAKHYRALMRVHDTLSANGRPILEVLPRLAFETTVHQGYDGLIAEYKEERRAARYSRVLFPTIHDNGNFYAIAVYDPYRSFLLEWPRWAGRVEQWQEGALDLRAPSALYRPPDQLPFPASMPYFSSRSDESIVPYGDQHFWRAVRPYLEVTVVYSELLPVGPLEHIAVRGHDVVINSIEEDLERESTTIIAERQVA